MSVRLLFAVVLSLGCLTGEALAQAKPKPVTYAEHVAPLLEDKCTVCHDPEDTSGGLDLASYDAIMRGGSSGDAVKPGDAEGSKLYRVVAKLEQPYMPRGDSPLTKAQLATLKSWLDQGARKDGASPLVKAKKKKAGLALPLNRATGAARPTGLALQPPHPTPRPDAVVALAASPGAPIFAVGALDQVLLYGFAPRALAGALPFPGRVHALRFSRDGALLFAAGGDGATQGRALLYDPASGREVFRLAAGKDVFLAGDLREDRRQIAVGGPSRKVEVYRVVTGELDYRLTKHTDWITAIAFSPDGVLLATADRSGGLHLWESRTGRLYQSLSAHPAAIHALAWRPDSNLLVSGCEDGQLRAFEVSGGREVKKLRAHGGGVLALSFAPDGRLASVGRDTQLKIWDTLGKLVSATPRRGDQATQVAFGHDARTVVAGDWRGTLRTWTLETPKPVAKKGKKPPGPRLVLQRQFPANPPSIEVRLSGLAAQAKRLGAEAQRASELALQLSRRTRVLSALERKTRRMRQATSALARRPHPAVASRRALVGSLRDALAALERSDRHPLPAPPASAPPAKTGTPTTKSAQADRALVADLLRRAEEQLKHATAATRPERLHRQGQAERAAKLHERARAALRANGRRPARAWLAASEAQARLAALTAQERFWAAELAHAKLHEQVISAAKTLAERAGVRAAKEAALASVQRQSDAQAKARAAAKLLLKVREEALETATTVATESAGLHADLSRVESSGVIAALSSAAHVAKQTLDAAQSSDERAALTKAHTTAVAALEKARERQLQLEAFKAASAVGAKLAQAEAKSARARLAVARAALTKTPAPDPAPLKAAEAALAFARRSEATAAKQTASAEQAWAQARAARARARGESDN